MTKIAGICFAIDTRPQAFCDRDHQAVNLEFLKSIDPSYFEFLADVLEPRVVEEGKGAHHAGIALRISYSQAMETMFALLASCVQSPSFPVGWMLNYKVSELKAVVKKISQGEPVDTKLDPNFVSWSGLSSLIHGKNLTSPPELLTCKKHFGIAWTRCATEFTQGRLDSEYNSIKHGLRIRSGGFQLAIGKQESIDEPAPRENMVSLGGSAFGSSFLKSHRLGKHNFSVSRTSVNWDPQNVAAGLRLLAASIRNVVSFLRCIGGDAEEQNLRITGDESFFAAPWERSVGTLDFSIGPAIKEGDVVPFSKDEIMRAYQTEAQKTEFGVEEK